MEGKQDESIYIFASELGTEVIFEISDFMFKISPRFAFLVLYFNFG